MKRAGRGAKVSVLCACIALAWACLPNLSLTQPSPSSGPAAVTSCGDGVIEPDAGDGGGEECDPGDAAAQGCSASCKVTCTIEAGSSPFVDPRTNHCYLQLSDVRDIVTAESDCAAYGGHVVRFVDQEELSLVARNAGASPFWVGLRATSDPDTPDASPQWVPTPVVPTSEPGWAFGDAGDCAGCFAYVDGGPIPAGDPALGYEGECVASPSALAGATWTQSLCEVPKDAGALAALRRYTICEREPPGSRTVACGDGGACFTVAVTTKHYVVGSAPVPASDAVAFCQSLGPGAQLVVFDSPEEREEVAYEIGRQTIVTSDAGAARNFWLGLTSDGGTWGWEADGGLLVVPWALNQPYSPTGRAYVIVLDGTLSSGLARVASSEDTHYALCQN